MIDEDILEYMIGMTFDKVKTSKDDDVLEFITKKGDVISFQHTQDCCESVRIEEIHGDLSDLIKSPILLAEVVSFKPTNDEGATNIRPDRNEWGEITKEYYDSATWTFYKFATINGSVTIRWLGESNGYYSESVDICYNPYFVGNLPAYAEPKYDAMPLEVAKWFNDNNINAKMNDKEETLFKLRFL